MVTNGEEVEFVMDADEEEFQRVIRNSHLFAILIRNLVARRLDYIYEVLTSSENDDQARDLVNKTILALSSTIANAVATTCVSEEDCTTACRLINEIITKATAVGFATKVEMRAQAANNDNAKLLLN